MKKILMAVVCACTLVANAKDIDVTVNMKLVSDKIETNTYGNAINFYKQGLHEVGNWGSYINCNYYGTITNAIYFSCATNSIRIANYYGDFSLKCGQGHISDWPKSTTTEVAVQRVRKWESTVTHGTQTVVSVYEKYEYPTKLITMVATTVIKYETTVITNSLSLSLEKEIVEVEKRK